MGQKMYTPDWCHMYIGLTYMSNMYTPDWHIQENGHSLRVCDMHTPNCSPDSPKPRVPNSPLIDTLPALRPPPLCPVTTWPPETPTHLSQTGRLPVAPCSPRVHPPPALLTLPSQHPVSPPTHSAQLPGLGTCSPERSHSFLTTPLPPRDRASSCSGTSCEAAARTLHGRAGPCSPRPGHQERSHGPLVVSRPTTENRLR